MNTPIEFKMEWAGITLMIEVTVSPIIPAKTNALPEDCYPAEGGEVEILSVYVSGDISEDQLEYENLYSHGKNMESLEELIIDAAQKEAVRMKNEE